MTTRLALVIDLDICVGCHACSIACKGGSAAEALHDSVWPNQVFGFEVEGGSRTVYVPRMCQHCESPGCVTVCPTGASFQRAADGVVMIDAERCIGCRLCAWACPYGTREYDEGAGVMRKCTLCNERREAAGPAAVPACVATCPSGARHFGDIGDPASAVSGLVRQRGGFALLPEAGYRPAVRYLPPRPGVSGLPAADAASSGGLQRWMDRVVSR
jgi:Fe-S-cluster-containing dehydrogenase component